MKTITFNKKLALNKKTIVNLTNNEMNQVNAGVDTTFAGSCTSEPVTSCGTSWDVCDPTICATICDWTEQPRCTFGCAPE